MDPGRAFKHIKTSLEGLAESAKLIPVVLEEIRALRAEVAELKAQARPVRPTTRQKAGVRK